LIENFNPRKIKTTKQEAILQIEKYAQEGVSIAYHNDKITFVRYAIPGETVRANIYKETSTYAMAEPVEILSPSPDRIVPFCRYFALCGGCDYQMLSYEKELEVKKNLVCETFDKIGKIDITSIIETVRSPEEFFYRNTETFKVNPKAKKIGFFRKDSKSVIDVEECALAMKGINEALRSVKSQAEFPPHNFKVRTTCDGETTVNWIKTDYQDKSVYERITAAGREIKFKISKDSFFQVNDCMIPLWLEKIIGFLDANPTEKIIDLYCGIGLITLFVSHYARETIGIEIATSSVKDAMHNLEINGIRTNVSFIEGAVEDKLESTGSADVMIIDPPRKGIDPKGLETLLKYEPKKIIYSSCKSSTMARDIGLLSVKYDLAKINLIDMFPRTHHVEMLALLLRK
jgi:23S rRNA (uracil1939-C5)-methyltransferase